MGVERRMRARGAAGSNGPRDVLEWLTTVGAPPPLDPPPVRPLTPPPFPCQEAVGACSAGRGWGQLPRRSDQAPMGVYHRPSFPVPHALGLVCGLSHGAAGRVPTKPNQTKPFPLPLFEAKFFNPRRSPLSLRGRGCGGGEVWTPKVCVPNRGPNQHFLLYISLLPDHTTSGPRGGAAPAVVGHSTQSGGCEVRFAQDLGPCRGLYWKKRGRGG